MNYYYSFSRNAPYWWRNKPSFLFLRWVLDWGDTKKKKACRSKSPARNFSTSRFNLGHVDEQGIVCVCVCTPQVIPYQLFLFSNFEPCSLCHHNNVTQTLFIYGCPGSESCFVTTTTIITLLLPHECMQRPTFRSVWPIHQSLLPGQSHATYHQLSFHVVHAAIMTIRLTPPPPPLIHRSTIYSTRLCSTWGNEIVAWKLNNYWLTAWWDLTLNKRIFHHLC